jgi:hypothetical protein
MAIYRPPKSRWPTALVLGLVGLLIGLLIGWLAFGRAEPDPEEALETVQETLGEAATTLEIVVIEYSESVDGTEVVNRTEYEGARDALARSRSSYQEVRAATALVDEGATQSIDGAYDELEQLVDDPASAEDVEAKADELEALLRDVIGGGS